MLSPLVDDDWAIGSAVRTAYRGMRRPSDHCESVAGVMFRLSQAQSEPFEFFVSPATDIYTWPQGRFNGVSTDVIP
jgi:hypothetical protein